jgi:uncharacterized caspase-like protein
LALMALSAACPASAETRIALIIGNSSYASRDLILANPVNDANAMDRALKAAGFETILVPNATREQFYHAVEDFSARISRDPSSIGLFYYAGHGVQADGINYLIPIDAKIEAESDLDLNAYDAGKVLKAMRRAQNQMNIVILDACRNNPLPKTRGVERGLARMEAPSGTFIAYAAAPGQEAHDGAKGTNGVFTGELVKAMAEPGMPLEQMFKKVIAGVKAETQGKQEPWSEASIQGDFYFHVTVGGKGASPAPAPPSPAVDPKQIELTFWTSIQNSADPADFQDYLKMYPRGSFSSLAERKLAHLQEAAHPARPVQQAALPLAPSLSRKVLRKANPATLIDLPTNGFEVTYFEENGFAIFQARMPTAWSFNLQIDANQDGVWGHGAADTAKATIGPSADIAFGVDTTGKFCPQYILSSPASDPEHVSSSSFCGALPSQGSAAKTPPDVKGVSTTVYKIPVNEVFAGRDSARIAITIFDGQMLHFYFSLSQPLVLTN